jgi:hypothetical protein
MLWSPTPDVNATKPFYSTLIEGSCRIDHATIRV